MNHSGLGALAPSSPAVVSQVNGPPAVPDAATPIASAITSLTGDASKLSAIISAISASSDPTMQNIATQLTVINSDLQTQLALLKAAQIVVAGNQTNLATCASSLATATSQLATASSQLATTPSTAALQQQLSQCQTQSAASATALAQLQKQPAPFTPYVVGGALGLAGGGAAAWLVMKYLAKKA